MGDFTNGVSPPAPHNVIVPTLGVSVPGRFGDFRECLISVDNIPAVARFRTFIMLA